MSLQTASGASIGGAKITRREAEDFVIHEAELLDELRLEEWLGVFSRDGIYWLPITDSSIEQRKTSLIFDNAIAREERIHHLLGLPFPAQSPRSRTIHCVSNLRVEDAGAGVVRVKSNQVIYETRGGDYTQAGLGEITTTIATVVHDLVRIEGQIRIALKKVLLLNRDKPLGNLTFMI